MILKTKDAIRESQSSTKTKYILLIHSPDEPIFGIQQSLVDQKKATMNSDEDKYYLLTPYPTLMEPLKSFHQKAIEPLPAIQISIDNRSAYTLNLTFNITYVHNIFKNYSQKWTLYNDNQ